jgi:hypothetical protein
LYNKVNCDKCPYDYNGRGNGKSECTAELASDALDLLEEQEAQKFFVDESGKITPLPVVVRCKDCKYYRATPGYCAYDRIWQENKGHIWGMYCKPDWFCADGERKEVK